MEEEFQDIKKRIFKHKNSEELFLKRVPVGTVKLFKAYANDEFAGDYGLCLKSMTDELLVKPPIYMNLQEQLFKLFEELEELKKKIEGIDSPETESNNIVERVNGVRMIKRKD